MLSFTSLSALLLLSNNINKLVSADTCRGDDPLACSGGGICRDGIKDYLDVLKLDHSVGMMPKEKRGMHCVCPDDDGISKFGMSGLHCTSAYERCGDNSACFNGGFCERESNNMTKYHCGCPQDEKDRVWAGKTCEVPATNFCGTNDSFFDVTGTRWFCTNNGECLSFPLKIWVEVMVHKNIIFDICIAFELNKLELSAKNSQIKKCIQFSFFSK